MCNRGNWKCLHHGAVLWLIQCRVTPQYDVVMFMHCALPFLAGPITKLHRELLPHQDAIVLVSDIKKDPYPWLTHMIL